MFNLFLTIGLFNCKLCFFLNNQALLTSFLNKYVNQNLTLPMPSL